MAETYSVEAYLKATGVDQFSKAFGDASQNVQGLEKSSSGASISVGTLLKTIGGVVASIGAFRMLTSSLDGAISRFDTLSSFPRVLQLLGFDAQESEKAVSKLSDGIDGLPTTLDSVASTTQRIASMTGDLDGAVNTTLALNNAFLASGSSTADASRGLEQYVQLLSRGEVDLEAWRTLQETMPVALNKTAEAFGYTGRSAQNDLYDALKEGELTFDQFNNKLIELSTATGGFADMARESSTGIATSWQNVRTAVVKGLADMIDVIDQSLSSFGGISGVFDSLKVGVQTVFGWINANIPIAIGYFQQVYNTLKPWIPLITSAVVAFLTFNTVMSVINGVKTAVSGLRVGLALLNATLLANPIALVIAVLAGLAVMFVHLWNTSETFRTSITNVFNSFLSFVMPVVQTVVNFIMTIWGQLVIWWQMNNQMILQAAQNVWNVISTVISTVMNVIWTIMQALWPVIQVLIVSTWNAIKGVIQGAITVITGIISAFSALFTGNWSALWESIKQIVSGAVQFVWNWIQLTFVGKILKAGKTLAKTLGSTIKKMWDDIKFYFQYAVDWAKGFVAKGFNGIKNTVTTVMNSIRNVINTVWNFIKQIITNVLNSIKSTVSTIWNGISTTIRTIVNQIKSTISNIFNSFKGVVSRAFNGVKSAVKSGITGAYNTVTGMFGKFLNAGKNIVGSIADGIKGAIGKVTDAIGSVTQKIRDFLPFSPAKEGALRDIMKIQIPQSIAESIDRGRNVAIKAMANLSNAINGEMPTTDIAGQINGIHARSQRQMSYDYTNELTINKQPANINFFLGRQSFKAFVEDITEVQEQRVQLISAFNQ